MSNDSTPHQTTQRTLFSDGPLHPTPRSACVVVIHGEGIGRRADIREQPVIVGRSPESDLVIAHNSVSRRHCRIRRDGSQYRLTDLGATNPTRLNHAPLDADVELADGDQITVGESILKFISQDSVEARYHEEIYQLAVHDALTELCNRRHFTELADKEIGRAMRHQRPLALCIIDVDLFKPINDRHGHISGDEVLRQIGGLVRRHARGDDVAARIGGEEFALLLPECGLDTARECAERLREAVAATPFAPGGEPQRITISIGIAALGPQCDTRSRLMAAADVALYRAKNEGRNCVRLQPPQPAQPTAADQR
ncbi:GGDEF domain-containing protein [Thermomonas paludicola]|uniref:GGDEF domain-containing protein n=1 Tax=Thermomonas paludicola TaxID=2884874 RepID=UPI002114D407|nr:GGDEF domain-containing protein [Thermomonas paludicola]